MLLLLIFPAAIIGPIVLKAFEYVSFTPAIQKIVNLVKGLLQKIVVGSLGDIYVVVEDDVQSAKLRDEFIEQLRSLANKQDAEKVEKIVILAHSTGNLIVYDALATLYQRAKGPNGEASRKLLDRVDAFVSIGSIMTLAWKTGVVDSNNDRYRRPLPAKLRWLDLWTRFDIATAGVLAAPRIPDGMVGPINRRVTNFGSIGLDHTGYWENIEEVYLLLLDELGGRNTSNYFWRGSNAGVTEKFSPEELADIKSRRVIVPVAMWWNSITWFSIPVSFTAFWIGLGLTRWFANLLDLGKRANDNGITWVNHMVDPNSMFEAWERPSFALGLALILFEILMVIWLVLVRYGWWRWKIGNRRRSLADKFKKKHELPQQSEIPGTVTPTNPTTG